MNTRATKFRWTLGMLMFLITFISYMDRVNLSVATPAIMSEFNFSKIEIGALQTCFFVGYAAMQIPGGMLAEYFKHRTIVPIAVTWWSLFTALTAGCSSFFSFAVVRSLFGLGEGPIFPALTTFISRWFPKTEKARASSVLLCGAYIGPVVGPAVTVAIMAAVGWRSVFVIFGLAGLVFAALWYFLATVSPRDSKFVNQAEIDLIEAEAGGAAVKREVAPWSKFLTSSQFWAIGLQFFIADYIMYVYLAWLPMYLMEAQKFSMAKMGIAASFPWAALCIVTLGTGWIGDSLIAAGASKQKARTYLAIAGLVLCSTFLYLGAVATDPTLNVLWLTLSLGTLGLTLASSWAAALDLGGMFSGSVVGWMNFWGNMGGVSAPLVTAWVATVFGWQAAILATAASAVVGAVIWFFVKPDVPLKIRA